MQKSRLHAHIGTLRQLEILLAVEQQGSITAAAEQLHLTQPTVSIQLKKLAEAIGLPLYDQLGRRLVFTEAGRAVCESAREVLACFERLDMTLADLKGVKAGTLRLAVVTTSKYFIPHLLGGFCQRYPEIEIVFKVGNRQQIIERMDSGLDDFYVFSHPPSERELELREFLPNPLVAIAATGHPLADQRQIPLATFAAEPFLMREAGSGTRHAIERHLAQQGEKLNVRMTIESNEAIKHAVMSGLGVSLLSRHSLAFGGRSGLVELDVDTLPIETKWYLASLRHKKMSIVGRAFLDFLSDSDISYLLAELAPQQLESRP
ncbi:LysR family transcriptional regulator [Marinobacterium arenosum]|uniref:LysR family transcriptional regulator n=1 Tax=Marinobacterium arenosum TaxID=2862496 RepID=UPI001C94D957|nr:LysR family transcriptional regulator [Marinobacterium arenosum]MBY4678117.1 LysR family transcriptional regulator [Marinobacterium arenosum]